MCESSQTSDKTNSKSIRRQLSEMSSKGRIKLVLKLVIIVLCVSGLIIQTTDLVLQYIKRQTVVNVQIETIKYNKIPAITLCYPCFLSMERVLNEFPEWRHQFDEIQSQMKNDSNSDHKNKTLIEFYKNITFFVENSDFSVEKLFDLSLPFEFERSVGLKPIEIKVKGIRLQKNGSLNEFEKQDKSPIESIVFPDGRQGFKCFTFFHHLNKEMTDYQMDVKEISIEMYHKEEWFPLGIYSEKAMISFSMHSPQSFPQQMNANNFLRLKAGKEFEITYNRWKTILLEPPYMTDCRQYRLSDDNDNKMRSDCVDRCIQSELKENCFNISGNNMNSTEFHFRSDALRRKDYSFSNNNKISVKICPKISKLPNNLLDSEEELQLMHSRRCIDNNINHLNSICEKRCKSECVSRFYNYNIKTNIKHNLTQWYFANNRKLASITIAHNQLPDQITEHLAEMPFTQFAANFGGLFGMWLGLSALAILQYFLKLLL